MHAAFTERPAAFCETAVQMLSYTIFEARAEGCWVLDLECGRNLNYGNRPNQVGVKRIAVRFTSAHFWLLWRQCLIKRGDEE